MKHYNGSTIYTLERTDIVAYETASLRNPDSYNPYWAWRAQAEDIPVRHPSAFDYDALEATHNTDEVRIIEALCAEYGL